MANELQQLFLTEVGEEAYHAAIGDLIRDGQYEEADAQLSYDLASLNTGLAHLCGRVSPASVTIQGWDEINASLEAYEGDPITALGIDMANPEGIALGSQGAFEPRLHLSFLSDESFPFSHASRDQLLGECHNPWTPWEGQGEDIEAYIEIEGLATLNQALLNCRTRVFVRTSEDEAPSYRKDELGNLVRDVVFETPTEAPADYIAFQLASWVRILRFHQAVRLELDHEGLVGSIPVLLGSSNIKPWLGTVIYPKKAVEVVHRPVGSLESLIKREIVVAEEVPVEANGSSIRRQIEEEGNVVALPPARRSFWSRLFARRAA